MDVLSLKGELIPAASLSIAKASRLTAALTSGKAKFASLVECRRNLESGREAVVFDVDVEQPTEAVYPIAAVERIAVEFDHADRSYPFVWALRSDFPRVPHLNLTIADVPRSLCLYEQAYEEVKLNWGPLRLIEEIREWLRRTARGELHDESQGLEPILGAAAGVVVLPFTLLREHAQNPARLVRASRIVTESRITTYFVDDGESPRKGDGTILLPMFFATDPMEHGIITRGPRTLADLTDFLAPAGLDLIGGVRHRLSRLMTVPADVLVARVLLVVLIPKIRRAGARIEAADVWAFVMDVTVGDLGAHVGLWELRNGSPGLVLPPSIPADAGHRVPLGLLLATDVLDRGRAEVLSGLAGPNQFRITLVGAGALGSHVVMNSVRVGFGRWTTIDRDVYLPHNVARSGVVGDVAGLAKVLVIQQIANETVQGNPVEAIIEADVLAPGPNAEAIDRALATANVIIDSSASIPVARYLVRGIESTARRVSTFLSPSGSDLVVLAEDAARTVLLDSLEMQYLREVATNDRLRSHLASTAVEIRYARSCADITTVLEADVVAGHGALASRVLRRLLANPDAAIRVYHSDPSTFEVAEIRVPVRPIESNVFGEWTLVTDQAVIETMHQLRVSRLPNETGGVLIGSVDTMRRIIYVVDILPSPADSVEWPTVYVRGCEGLLAAVTVIGERTRQQVRYIGEWHSHPDGCSIDPSRTDREAFDQLAAQMARDDEPAVMLIVGEHAQRWFVDEMQA